MTPCGMCCDERSSLSFQRAIHGSGVDDWTWGRWYRCRPGAEDLGRWIAYGHPGWETEVGTHFSEAEYQIQVGRRPVGRLGGNKPSPHRKVERYAPARTTPFPGLESHGEDAWYADGLPRERYYRGDEIIRCGARIWQTEGGIGIPDVDDAPDYLLSMSGGGEGGGHMDVGTDCYIWYGGCIHVAGGGEGGGTMPMYASESFDLAGGGEGGGTMPTDGSEGFALAGGGEGGGTIPLDAADSLYMSGGGEGGGESGTGGGVPLWHAGLIQLFDTVSPALVTVPAHVPGDTVLLYVISTGTAVPDTPPGYSLIHDGTDPSFDPNFYLYEHVVAEGDDPTFLLTWDGSGQISFAIVTVSNGGNIIPATFLISDVNPVVPPFFMGIPPGSLVVLFFLASSAVGLDTPPDWMTEGAIETSPTLGIVYYNEDTEDVETPDTEILLNDAVEYAVGFVIVQPLPDEGDLP